MGRQSDSVRKAILEFHLESADAATKIGDINKQIKNLQNEALKIGRGGKGFEQLTGKANELRSKIDDLGDSMKTLKGNGVERLTNSMSLLQDGFNSFDGGKIKLALSGIGKAMSAIPIFALIQGIQYLIENFDTVAAVAKELFTSLSDEEKKVKELTKELEHQKEVTATLTNEINREIAVLEAQGATTDKIIAKKKQLIDQQIKEAAVSAELSLAKIKQAQAEDTFTEASLRLEAQVARKLGFTKQAEEDEKKIQALKYDRVKDEVKTVLESIETIKNLRNEAKVNEIKNQKEIADATKKVNEEIKDLKADLIIDEDIQALEKIKLERDRAIQEVKESRATTKAKNEAINLIEQEYSTKREDILKRFQIQQLGSTELFNQMVVKDQKKTNEAIEKLLDEQNKSYKLKFEEKKLFTIEVLRDISGAMKTTFGEINKIFTDSPLSGLIGSLTNGIAAAFDVIILKSKQMTEKIAVGLGALANVLGSINTLHDNSVDKQTEKIEASYARQFSALEYTRDLELNKEGLTAQQKQEIENNYAKQKYQLELQKYNKETAIKKQAFETDKKLQIAQTTIQTLSGSLIAFTSMLKAFPAPYNFIAGGVAAAAVAAMGAIQVQQIAKTKFEAAPAPTEPILPPVPAGSGGEGGGNSFDSARMNDFSLYGTAGRKNNLGTEKKNEMTVKVESTVNVSEITTTQNKLEKYKTEAEL